MSNRNLFFNRQHTPCIACEASGVENCDMHSVWYERVSPTGVRLGIFLGGGKCPCCAEQQQDGTKKLDGHPSKQHDKIKGNQGRVGGTIPAGKWEQLKACEMFAVTPEQLAARLNLEVACKI